MIQKRSPGPELSEILSLACFALQPTDEQYETAKRSYEAVGSWLANESPLSHLRPEVYPQGSAATQTLVRPLRGEEFDVDLILLMQRSSTGLNPSAVLREVQAVLATNTGLKTELKPRCVRLLYRGYHLDVVPAVPDETAGGTRIRIPDRDLMRWVPSDPKAFAQWFGLRTSLQILRKLEGVEALPEKEPPEFKTNLQRTVQILKRWRDFHWQNEEPQKPVSIVLTTLAGMHFRPAPSLYDVVQSVVARILEQSKMAEGPLQVMHPALPGEILSHKWVDNPKSYETFVRRLREFEEKWVALSVVEGMDQVRKVLESILGPEIPKVAIQRHMEGLREARDRRELAMDRSTGIITAGAITDPTVVPVRSHNFYGD